MTNSRLQSVPTPRRRACAGCGIGIKGDLPLCRQCWFGNRFYRAARDFLRATRR